MNYKHSMAQTPAGATLGQRITINGEPGIHYKAGKKEDDLTMKQLVECASGMKVLNIIYAQQLPKII